MHIREIGPTVGLLLLAAVTTSALVGCTVLATGAHDGSQADDPQIPLPSVATLPPSPTPTDPMDAQAPVVPSPKPGVTVDAAAQAKAKAWLAGAVVPPTAVKVASPPPGTSIGAEGQGWWCAPMATASGYWTVSGMDMTDTANWLSAHPSDGLTVVNRAYLTPDPSLTNASVSDFASANSFEGMTFDLATWGRTGTVIHVEIGVLARDSACATAPPGTQLETAGG